MYWFKFVLEMIGSIGVIVASFVAIKGISAWQKQRNTELAEDVLEYFYKARDAFKRIRSPVGYKGEGESRKAEDWESESDKRINNRAYIPIERLNKELNIFEKIETLKYRFIARFGEDKKELFVEILGKAREITTACHLLKELWKETHPLNETSKEMKEKYEKVI